MEVGGLGLYQILHLRQEDKVRNPNKRSGAVLSSQATTATLSNYVLR